MIGGITGNTGGGKTYRAVQLILKALSEGRPVVTNIPLTFEHELLHSWSWDILEPSPIINLPYPKGALYVLDEAWRMDTMKIAARKNVTLLSFFKEHRHRTNEEGISDDIFLITQDLADINTAVRTLCQQTIICIKPTEIAISGASLRMYHEGAVTGVKLVQKKLLKQEIEFFKTEVFACYKTDTLGSGQGGHDKENTALKTSLFNSAKFKFYALLFVVSVTGFFFLFYRVKTQIAPKYFGNPTTQQQPQPLPATVPPSIFPTHEQNNKPLDLPNIQQKTLDKSKDIYSVNWRISGVVANKKTGKLIVYASDYYNHVRRLSPQSCTHDDYGQYECILDGQRLTFFSGPYMSTDKSVSNTVSAAIN